MFRTVVLPAPFGPMTDMMSPWVTSRLTRVTACTPPNALDTSRISSNALITNTDSLGRAGRTPSSICVVERDAAPARRGGGAGPGSARGAPGPPALPPTRAGAREPPLPPTIMLHVAVRLALPDTGQSQVELLDVLVIGDRPGVAVQHDAAGLHDIAVLGELQRDRRVLLGEQHG